MITRTILRQFRTDFEDAVKDLETKYNVSLSLGSISYSDKEFHGKLTADVVNPETGKSVDKDKENFMKYCHVFGLAVTDYGKTFKHNTKIFEIIGIKPNARKNAIIIKDQNGRDFVAPVDMIKRQLGIQ